MDTGGPLWTCFLPSSIHSSGSSWILGFCNMATMEHLTGQDSPGLTPDLSQAWSPFFLHSSYGCLLSGIVQGSGWGRAWVTFSIVALGSPELARKSPEGQPFLRGD